MQYVVKMIRQNFTYTPSPHMPLCKLFYLIMSVQVEEEFVDKLDVFLSKDGMGDEEYKELFEQM